MSESLHQNGVWGAVAFGVALAVVIGTRLDQAALAVVVGVACGVGASIPTGLLIVSLLRRRDAREERQNAQSEPGGTQPPPVVIVSPRNIPQLRPSNSWPEEYASSLPAQRQFSVIGDEEMEDL